MESSLENVVNGKHVKQVPTEALLHPVKTKTSPQQPRERRSQAAIHSKTCVHTHSSVHPVRMKLSISHSHHGPYFTSVTCCDYKEAVYVPYLF